MIPIIDGRSFKPTFPGSGYNRVRLDPKLNPWICRIRLRLANGDYTDEVGFFYGY
jgi:hypothetical protein